MAKGTMALRVDLVPPFPEVSHTPLPRLSHERAKVQPPRHIRRIRSTCTSLQRQSTDARVHSPRRMYRIHRPRQSTRSAPGVPQRRRRWWGRGVGACLFHSLTDCESLCAGHPLAQELCYLLTALRFRPSCSLRGSFAALASERETDRA